MCLKCNLDEHLLHTEKIVSENPSSQLSDPDPGFFNGGWLIQSATKLYVDILNT